MQLTNEQIFKRAWQRGNLSYKLRDYQRPLYKTLRNALENPKCYKYVVNCSRRFGKSTILMIIAFEECIRRPNIDVRFTSDTGKHMKEIVESVKKEILADCPADSLPEYTVSNGKFHFKNGSTLHTYGADNGIADGQRGVNSHLNIIDEAGFISDLDETLHSIILPQCDTTGGKTFMISTPSDTPGHDFYNLSIEAEALGYYSKYTMDDNTFYSVEKKEEIYLSRGGKQSTRVRREYFGEWVVEADLVVIPEWKDDCIQAIEKDEFYKFYHKYECMDLGFKDFTATLFGYYDFKRAALIIEDELTSKGGTCTSLVLSNNIRAKEKELWGDQEVYARYCDSSNPQFIATMSNEQKMYFSAINNKDPEGQINTTRLMVNAKKILIHPRCKLLIGCLKYAVWDKKRNCLGRSSVYGHYDHLMALVYLVSNIDKYTNPIPRDYSINRYETVVTERFKEKEITDAGSFGKMFPQTKVRKY